MRILVLNGPNLNLLGLREPELYGRADYNALCALIEGAARDAGVSVTIRQSNHEGVLVDEIQAALGRFDALVLNPAAYTHTSVALRDAVKAVGLPAVEVHLTRVSEREPFRQVSYIRDVCRTTFEGMGFEGYRAAIAYLARLDETAR